MALRVKTTWSTQTSVARFGALDAARHGDGAALLQRILAARAETFPPGLSLKAAIERAGAGHVTLLPAARDGEALVFPVQVGHSARCGFVVALIVRPSRPDVLEVAFNEVAPLTRRLAQAAMVVVWAIVAAAIAVGGYSLGARGGWAALVALVGLFAAIPAGAFAMMAFLADNVGADEAATATARAKLLPLVQAWVEQPPHVQVVI